MTGPFFVKKVTGSEEKTEPVNISAYMGYTS